jgi:hypothetical protein
MAESVKRRVAAARLAVAFVAAGTIAGAAAWAQASPAATAKESILISSSKIKLDSSNIKNGSLLFQDFIKGEVPSGKQFKKLESSFDSFKQTTDGSLATIKGEASSIKAEVSSIKAELGSYIKSSDADARYIKLSDDVVRGDGSVFTASTLYPGKLTQVLNIPNLISVSIFGADFRITNNSGSSMTHTSCAPGGNGTIAAGAQLVCTGSSTSDTVQLIGAGGQVLTLSFSAIGLQNGTLDTVQILIGL